VTAQDFLSAISQLIYLVLFAIASVRLVRLRTWIALDTFLFFGVIAAILLLGDAARVLGLGDQATVGTIGWIGVAILPYLLLRLADDFQPRRWYTMALASLSVAGVVSVGIAVPQPWPLLAVLALVAHFVVFGGYASYAFLSESRRSHGGTRRRMQAVALGSGLIALIFLLGGIGSVFPQPPAGLPLTIQVLSLVAVIAYYVGFAPPPILQRGWQEPAIRSALARAAELVSRDDPHDIGTEYARAAMAATGAQGAAVGIWDEASGKIRFRSDEGELQAMAPGEAISGRAFAWQKAVSTSRAERDAPERADEYRRSSIRAIVAAPITSGDRRLGVLTVYAVRPPMFTDDVVSVVRMLAEQAALVLRSQELLREAAQVRAMAEMTRMKDDFLSVVAHDVRTPLTTILLNAELLAATPADDRNARRATSLHAEAMRLKQLVEDYLDVVRVEHQVARTESRRETCDIVKLARDSVSRVDAAGGRVTLLEHGPVTVVIDAGRVSQLVQNLVGNALKYSDPYEPIELSVEQEEGQALIRVTDRGIGIPEADLPFLFERFHRGSNTDDRRYRGLGLGLYICKQVAEEHGGEISVDSRIGEGTTFTVRLPAVRGEPPAAADVPSGPMDRPAPAAAPPEPVDAGGLAPQPPEASGEALA
jgi:signal transduction histidine kinase